MNVLLALIFNLSFAGMEPHEANKITFEKYLHEDSIEIPWEKVNAGIFVIIRAVSNQLGEKALIISICRPTSKGQHSKCNAVDMAFEFTSDECIWDSYDRHIKTVLGSLAYIGLLEDTGVGIYFRDEDGNGSQLSIHIDIRGRKSRWSFIGEDQLTFETGLDLLEYLIEKECR